MTNEEKAKAYDEALERARKQRDDYQKELNKADKNSQLAGLLRAGISAIELAFPELAESEDERIRKALIDFFEKKVEKGFEWYEYGIPNNAILAWLEKQKESLHISETCKEKPNSFTNEDERIRKEIVGVIQKHYPNTPESYRWISWLEKQKDQKPAEWDEYTKTNLDRALPTTQEIINTLGAEKRREIDNSPARKQRVRLPSGSWPEIGLVIR